MLIFFLRVDFSDVEIDVFFGNNDANGDGTIDVNESNNIHGNESSSSEDSDSEDEDEAQSNYSSRYGYKLDSQYLTD